VCIQQAAIKIQQKKDELYDLIVQGEKNVWTKTFQNAFLLQYLSEEVTPRQCDSHWYDIKQMQ
jgi:hypothetical protein